MLVDSIISFWCAVFRSIDIRPLSLGTSVIDLLDIAASLKNRFANHSDSRKDDLFKARTSCEFTIFEPSNTLRDDNSLDAGASIKHLITEFSDLLGQSNLLKVGTVHEKILFQNSYGIWNDNFFKFLILSESPTSECCNNDTIDLSWNRNFAGSALILGDHDGFVF